MAGKQSRRHMKAYGNEYAVTGNNALKPLPLEHSPYAFDEGELADIRAQYNTRSTKARREAKKAQMSINPLRLVGMITLLCVVAGSVGFLITREGRIANNMREIHKAKAELTEIERVNSTWDLRTKTIDPAWIEHEALGRLGMVREPTAYYTVVLPPDSGIIDAGAFEDPDSLQP